MKILESAENYLESILVLAKRLGNVRSIDVAARLNFSKPSVSNMMKRLRENGYILMDEDGFITLTNTGREIAERIFERHSLVAALLMDLGVSEDTARDDACRIEHCLSPETFECMKKHYGKLVTPET